MHWFYCFDLLGVAVFAISGALMAGQKSMDLFGVLVVAFVTALGGGTLRDVILGHRPGWLQDSNYLTVVAIAAMGTVLWVRRTKSVHTTGLLMADAFGLAVFTTMGTEVAMQSHVSSSAAVIMGLMTGVAGGVVRDIICNEIPLIFRQEIYATACIAGAATFLGLNRTGIAPELAMTGTILMVLTIRLAAMRWKLHLPQFRL